MPNVKIDHSLLISTDELENSWPGNVCVNDMREYAI